MSTINIVNGLSEVVGTVQEFPSSPAKGELLESEYTTRDFNIAAFMWCQVGANLDRYYNGSEGGLRPVIYFVFKLPFSEKQRETLLFDYYNSRTLVEPKAFVAAQNKLKDLIHSCK